MWRNVVVRFARIVSVRFATTWMFHRYAWPVRVWRIVSVCFATTWMYYRHAWPVRVWRIVSVLNARTTMVGFRTFNLTGPPMVSTGLEGITVDADVWLMGSAWLT